MRLKSGRLAVAFVAFLVSFQCAKEMAVTYSGTTPHDSTGTTPSTHAGRVASLTLQVKGDSLQANGSDQCTLTVVVRDSLGIALAGEPVQFVYPTQLQRIPGESVTNSRGQIAAAFATVQGGIYDIVVKYTTGTLTLLDTAHVAFSSVNATVIIDSAHSLRDSVYFYDATDIRVATRNHATGRPAAGQLVLFTMLDKKFGTVTDSAVTDSMGIAVGRFVSANVIGTASIQVSAGGLFRTVTVHVRAGENGPAAITAETNRSSICVSGTGGIANATLTFTVLTKLGTPVSSARRTKVRIAVIQGPGGGLYLSDSLLYTDASGRVSTVLNAGIKSGNVIVKATVVDSTLASEVSVSRALVAITGGPPDEGHFTIGPVMGKANLWGWDVVGNEGQVVAHVADR